MMPNRNSECGESVLRGVNKHLRILAPLVATAALAAAGCGGGSSSNADDGYGAPVKAKATAVAKAPAATTTVKISQSSFQPQVIDAHVGDTITFVNQDEIAHTATAQDGTFDSKTLNQGQSFSFTPAKAGKIAYVCQFHPGMTGTIDVT